MPRKNVKSRTSKKLLTDKEIQEFANDVVDQVNTYIQRPMSTKDAYRVVECLVGDLENVLDGLKSDLEAQGEEVPE